MLKQQDHKGKPANKHLEVLKKTRQIKLVQKLPAPYSHTLVTPNTPTSHITASTKAASQALGDVGKPSEKPFSPRWAYGFVLTFQP